jgi:hypothetical protein
MGRLCGDLRDRFRVSLVSGGVCCLWRRFRWLCLRIQKSRSWRIRISNCHPALSPGSQASAVRQRRCFGPCALGNRQVGSRFASLILTHSSAIDEPHGHLDRRLRARKPRTECCCQPVAAMMAGIVVPVRSCSIAMTCAFLLPARPDRVLATASDAAITGTGFDVLLLADFTGRELVTVLRLDFVLVMGSFKVCATPSAARPQPHPGKSPGGAQPKKRT